MSSLDSLSRQVKKLAERVLPAQEPFKFGFTLELFTPEEQEQLQHFLAQIAEKCERSHKRYGCLDLGELTREELDEFGYWAHLEDALKRQDVAAVTQYRRDWQKGAIT